MFRRQLPPFMPQYAYGPMFGRRPSVKRRAVKLAWTGTKKTIRHGHKHRRRYLPVYAAMFLAVAAEAAHWTPQGARSVAALAILCGPLLHGWMWLRNHPRALRWLHRSVRPVKSRARVHAWSLYALASMWAVAAAHYGVNLHAHTVGALIAGTIGFGSAYWWSRRVRPAIHVDTTDVDEIQADWDTYAAVPGGIAPGFTLADMAVLPDPQGGPTPVGFAAQLTAPKGDRFSLINTTEKIEQIAGIWDRSAADVALRPVPANARVGQLRVYTNNPLREIRYWPGPQMFDPETGLAQIANYADGDRALYRFYRRGSGPTHSLIAGASEAGKSRLLDQLLAIQRHSPFMASIVIDPQEGQSLPRWKKHVALYARNVTEGMAALRAVRDEMYRRNKLLADVEWFDDKGREMEGVDHFDPIAGPAAMMGLPLICLTIDELSMLLAAYPEAVEILGELLKMARKCGIQIVGALQNTLVDEMGGKSTALRSLWAQGNLIVFRCDELSSKSVKGGGVEFDGSVLPPEWPDGTTTAGLCYIRGSKARTEAARTLLVEDPYHWATTGTLTELPGLVSAFQRYLRADEDHVEIATATVTTTTKAAAKAETKVAQILGFLDEHGIATNAVIAERLNIQLGTVNGTLHRLHKQSRVHKVDEGMWAPLSYASELADELAA